MQNVRFPNDIEKVEEMGLDEIKKLTSLMMNKEIFGLCNYLRNPGFLSRLYNFCLEEVYWFADDLVRNYIDPSKVNDDLVAHAAEVYMLVYDNWLNKEIKHITQEKESDR